MSNSFHTHRLDARVVRTAPLGDQDEDDIVPWVIEFRIVGTPYILPAPLERQFIIGRSDSHYTPDVDLTDYGAHAKGVSRRHVQLTAAHNRLTLRDLGSANGTCLNGERAIPLAEHRLHHGDILSLGRFDLQVNFIVKPLEDEATPCSAASLTGFERFAHGQRLLVVDQNLDAARVIAFCAQRCGFLVTIAVSIEEAISQIDAALPDAVLTELLFDVGEGVDLIRYLREVAAERRVPVVVITNNTTGYTTGQALQQGADLFVGKPLAMDALASTLRQLLPLLAR